MVGWEESVMDVVDVVDVARMSRRIFFKFVGGSSSLLGGSSQNLV